MGPPAGLDQDERRRRTGRGCAGSRTMTEESIQGARQVVDLSHVITDGMVTYPGIPAPVIGAHLTFDESASHYAAGTEFSIGTISMAANTGTYLDTPAHRYRECEDLSLLSLDRMVDLEGVVARVLRPPAAGGRAIDESDLVSALGGIPPVGRAVLIETGHR